MRSTTANRNTTLSNYAKGVINESADRILSVLAPVVPVSVASGQYKDWDLKNAFQVIDAARGLGGRATRVEIDAASPYYNCQPYALDLPIDDFEADLAGEDAAADREEKVRALVNLGSLARLQKAKALVTAITAASGKGVWADNSGDPIAEINGQIELIAKATGTLPNTVVIDPTSLRIAGDNTKTIARQPGALQIGALTPSWLSSALIGNPNVVVAGAAQDTTKRGVAAANAFSLANTVVILFSSAAPTKYDLSAFKTFRTRSSGDVRIYRDEAARSDVLALDWAEDVKTVCSAAVAKITVN